MSTPLSPEAQAVLSAAHTTDAGLPPDRANYCYRKGAAAVLRSAALLIDPDEGAHNYTHGSMSEVEHRGRYRAARKLLNVAAELDDPSKAPIEK